jgi:hypothetical protein
MGLSLVSRTRTSERRSEEYRLLMFPLVLGTGERLFPDGTPPIELTPVSAQTAGSAVRLIYTRLGDR